jgi:nitroimidazol reductase NimA-like FMN-containing flavoprotein (pyridoxamine 5'-phosphate oxidase superfamily)
MPPPAPSIQSLTDQEIRQFLAAHVVGRLAYSFRDRVDIVPIHYVYDAEWIYGRTSAGPKLTTLTHSRWVAFEVDEVLAMFHWTSVVVRGALYLLDPEERSTDLEAWSRGVELLRAIVPETLTPDDPVPQRDVVFRIHVTEATGRRALPAG